MVSASPMASLPPGPASVLPGPGTTGITLALLGHSRKPPARYRGRQDFELLPAAVAGLTGGRGCHNLFRHDAQPRVTGTRYGDSGRMGSRSATRRRVGGTGTAHSIHHQEVGPATTGVWSSDAVITRR
jgi:hypothetical protein